MVEEWYMLVTTSMKEMSSASDSESEIKILNSGRRCHLNLTELQVVSYHPLPDNQFDFKDQILYVLNYSSLNL